MPALILLAKALLFIFGMFMVIMASFSAVRTFVLPRNSHDVIVRFVFTALRRMFNRVLRRMKTYEQRDMVMAFYGPVSLLALLPTWLVIIATGYTAMYWALGA